MEAIGYKRIWQISYPVLISVLMEQLVGMTDTAFLGRVGEVELGASALGGIFYIAIFVLGMGLGTGAQILMGRRNGEHQYYEVGNVFYHSLLLLLTFALVLFLGIQLGAPWLLSHLIQSPEVFQAACDYLQWRVFGFFFAYVAIMFRAFYVATTQTKTLTLNSVLMVTSNIFFNYILIFGKLGFPAFGIAGAAMGSVLAEAVSMLFFILYSRYCLNYRKYGLHLRPRFRRHFIARILRVSIWTMVQNFLSLGTWFLFFLAVEHLGERELAVSNILRNISSFFYVTVSALAATASTLVSNLMGRGEMDEVYPMIQKCIRLGFYILVPLCALVLIIPEWVIAIYTDEQVLVTMSVAPLFVLLLSYVFTIPQRILLSAVMGTGSTRKALHIEILSLILYTIFIYIVIYRLHSVLPVCWISEFVYAVPSVVLARRYLKTNHWRTRVL